MEPAGEDDEEIVPYRHDWRTCKDIINAALTFDAESEMCLVHAKVDEYTCCPSSTTEFVDYCNICPDGITADEFFLVHGLRTNLVHGKVRLVNYWFRMPKYSKMVPWVAITTRAMKCLAVQEVALVWRIHSLRHIPNNFILWDLLQQLLDQLWLW